MYMRARGGKTILGIDPWPIRLIVSPDSYLASLSLRIDEYDKPSRLSVATIRMAGSATRRKSSEIFASNRIPGTKYNITQELNKGSRFSSPEGFTYYGLL